MSNRMMSVAVLAALAGCAGTKQATSEPAAVPANMPPPVAVLAPEPASSLAVADVTPAASRPAAPQTAAEPYQCMLAWAKGMQDALMPWTHTAQACDTHAAKP